MEIGEETIRQVKESVVALMRDYQTELTESSLKAEKDFAFAFTVKVSPFGPETKVETKINFIKERVKDTVTRMVNERQTSFLEVAGGEE